MRYAPGIASYRICNHKIFLFKIIKFRPVWSEINSHTNSYTRIKKMTTILRLKNAVLIAQPGIHIALHISNAQYLK